LEASFTIAPLLIHANLSKPFVLETNVFDFALGVIFSQPKEDNLFHLIGFWSCKIFFIEINYEIYDKKFLVVVDAFEE
jgi:hypothetical protein